MMNLKKILIFSSLVNVNIIIWYEILGIKFLLGVLVVTVFLILEEGS